VITQKLKSNGHIEWKCSITRIKKEFVHFMQL
jgi:hypothetical protein